SPARCCGFRWRTGRSASIPPKRGWMVGPPPWCCQAHHHASAGARMSVIRELAAFVNGASAAALPAAERATQRRHVADTLVAAVAGARTTEGQALRRVLPCISIPPPPPTTPP